MLLVRVTSAFADLLIPDRQEGSLETSRKQMPLHLVSAGLEWHCQVCRTSVGRSSSRRLLGCGWLAETQVVMSEETCWTSWSH